MPRAKQTQAWLLPISANLHVLIPLSCGQELLEQPQIIPLPSARPDCAGLISWREQLLAVLDLRSIGSSSQPSAQCEFIMVLAYQQQQQIKFGALLLDAAPQVVSIDSKMNFPVPNHLQNYHYLPAAVQLEQQITPVLAIAELFASAS